MKVYCVRPQQGALLSLPVVPLSPSDTTLRREGDHVLRIRFVITGRTVPCWRNIIDFDSNLGYTLSCRNR